MNEENNKSINDCADELLEKIATYIDYKLKNCPRIESAIVSKVNSDGTVDVYIPPDAGINFTRISNQSIFQDLKVGDGVKLLLPKGSYIGCWVCGKHQ